MKRAGWRGKRGLGALAALVLVAGCSSAKPAPARAGSCPGWTRGETLPAWPRTRALLGFGTARTADRARGEEEARATAWADIARQIEVSVQSESKLAIWDSSSGDSGQNAREELRVRTSLALDSAEIVAHCFEPETSTVFVLAALEREKFAARGGAQIRELNTHGAGELARSRELAAAGRLLEATASGHRALEAARSAEQLGRLVRAVSGGAAPPAFESSSSMAAWLRELRTGARVRVVMDAAHQTVEQAVLRAITSSGFELAGSDAAEPVAIVVSGKVEDMGISRPDFGKILISRVRVVAQVTRADTGAVIGAVDRQESGGGLTEQLAREQAQAALAKTFSAEVKGILEAALNEAR